MRYAIVKDNIVDNIIEAKKGFADKIGAVYLADLPVSIGDVFEYGVFYRENEEGVLVEIKAEESPEPITIEQRVLTIEEENQALRKASQIATRDLIKTSALDPEEIEELAILYPEHRDGEEYKKGDLVRDNGKLYGVIQAHTGQDDWKPADTPALFKPSVPEGVIPDFVPPTGVHDAYNIGDMVIFEGRTYESVIDSNTWSPTEYPQGWKEV